METPLVVIASSRCRALLGRRDGGCRSGREVDISKPLKDAAGCKTLDRSLDGDSSETGESEDATAPDKLLRPFIREGKWEMSKIIITRTYIVRKIATSGVYEIQF